VIEIGVGDESSTGWVRSGKSVLIEVDEVGRLIASLHKAWGDIHEFGLLDEAYESTSRPSLRKRWGRD